MPCFLARSCRFLRSILASRVAALGAFYAVDLWNLAKGRIDMPFHGNMAIIIAVFRNRETVNADELNLLRW